jgi:hypothetical protein
LGVACNFSHVRSIHAFYVRHALLDPQTLSRDTSLSPSWYIFYEPGQKKMYLAKKRWTIEIPLLLRVEKCQPPLVSCFTQFRHFLPC